MKVGVLTFHYTMNHGAVLQCYSLCRKIRELGADPEIIDYRPWKVVRKQLMGIRSTIFQRRGFNDLLRPYLGKKTYWSGEDLGKKCPKYDVYIVGSDQVWNPKVHWYFDKSYFFDFVPEGQGKLASYAASFGGSNIPESEQNVVKILLGRFEHISVREKEGEEIISSLTGQISQVVLDPTFLIRDLASVNIKPKIDTPYIAAYCLERSEGFMCLLDRLKKITGLPVVALGSHIPGAELSRVYISPESWLGYMNNARYVCTNSFHGVAVSLVLRKPFFVYPISHRFSRISNILQTLGLESQIIREPSRLGAENVNAECIDFNKVEEILKQHIIFSEKYLKEILTV